MLPDLVGVLERVVGSQHLQHDHRRCGIQRQRGHISAAVQGRQKQGCDQGAPRGVEAALGAQRAPCPAEGDLHVHDGLHSRQAGPLTGQGEVPQSCPVLQQLVVVEGTHVRPVEVVCDVRLAHVAKVLVGRAAPVEAVRVSVSDVRAVGDAWKGEDPSTTAKVTPELLLPLHG